MAGGIIDIGLSGLLAAQQGLRTTGHNITNVNTEGYSRQQVQQGAREPQFFGGFYYGKGVDVVGVRRAYDAFLTRQVRDYTASAAEMGRYGEIASQVDNLLADRKAGVAPGLEDLFNAFQEVANDPTSVPVRQGLLSSAQALVDRFHDMAWRLRDVLGQINTGIRSLVDQVNELAGSIADLNRRIVELQGSTGQPPNDLLDRRDQALDQLAQLVGVSTVGQDDGAVNVFIGSGQALVVGDSAQRLEVTRNRYDPDRDEVSLTTGGGLVEVSDFMQGGRLGGLLKVRAEVVEPARNALGRVAAALALDLNRQHRLGQDLNGQAGADLFLQPQPKVRASSANTGTGQVQAVVASSPGLTASDYSLRYDGGNQYTLTRLSDGQTFAIDTGGAASFTTRVIDGIRLTIQAGAQVGDTFLVQPTAVAAEELALRVGTPAEVAAAAPIRAEAAAGNAGSGTIDAGRVNSPDDRVSIRFTSATTFDVTDESTGAVLAQGLSYTPGGPVRFNGWEVRISGSPAAGDRFYVDHLAASADPANAGSGTIGEATLLADHDPNLTAPVTITFTSPTTFDVSGASTGSPTTGVSYTPGQPISYNGWTVVIQGSPAAGDSFTVGPNTGGAGDNRNALALAGQGQAAVMEGQSATYGEAYGRLVSQVGARTRNAQQTEEARQALLRQAQEARDAVAGVNLDEEAAQLMQYQQAYQAAARVVTVAQTMFDTLLQALGR